ncbi:MAG: glucose-1-phosphate adenylyltransferase subunit GlgD [Clostridiales bacterium]|jgi:glucose-1-phosphate adenylyltransferase|nr:glucose-1-phosphate adenylyltransferase subunit GlgD [Clostridiales bacterium]
MLTNMTGVILADSMIHEMRELEITAASVPFGGRYRMIDFMLSSLVNSNIRDIAVVTPGDCYPVAEHLGSGREWDLARKKGGLTILPSRAGDADGKSRALYDALDYVKKGESRYVLIADANIIANLNILKLLNYHIEKHAFLTAVYKSNAAVSDGNNRRVFIKTDKNGRIINADLCKGNELYGDMLVGIYITERENLEYLLNQCIKRDEAGFGRDIILETYEDLDIYGYCYNGYIERIDTIKAYYNANMELLESDARHDLFKEGRIYTRERDLAPCLFGELANVKNSIIAEGCVIEGSVKNSVVFGNVRIGKNAAVENSIILRDTDISDGTVLNRCIAKKNIRISQISDNRGTISVVSERASKI